MTLLQILWYQQAVFQPEGLCTWGSNLPHYLVNISAYSSFYTLWALPAPRLYQIFIINYSYSSVLISYNCLFVWLFPECLLSHWHIRSLICSLLCCSIKQEPSLHQMSKMCLGKEREIHENT
jgi:hypothetical protein